MTTASEPNRLSPRNFQRLAAFIQDYCGIRVPPNKQVMIEGRLRRRVRALGFADIDAYCAFLFRDGGLEAEATDLVDVITTNKTEFFREASHFELLRQRVLPELAARGVGTRRPLKVWSAASSTGAEAYTLAMVISDFAAELRGFRTSILATDICTDVLRAGVEAVYPEEMIEPVPLEMRQRYLLRSRDGARREIRLAPEIRRLVRFARLNLMDEHYPVATDMDLIFCKNVLIYFDKPTQQAVVRRLCRHLPPDGYLFLGYSETIAGFDLPLRQVATAMFRKAAK